MINLQIDKKLVAKYILEINKKNKLIAQLFSEDNEHILKHLAAASIHMNFFARDLYEIIEGVKIDNDSNLENEFFDKCGCDFKV